MSEGMTGASGGGSEDQSFAEFQDYLDIHAKNGFILNGVLTWMDIQQKTTAPHVWRNQANAWFSEPEVLEAKEALWKVCENKIEVIGKLVNRTSDRKNVSIGDIGDAMAKLKEKSLMPLLLGSSMMMQRVPCYNTTNKDDNDVSAVSTRVKALEESMNEFMKQQAGQMSNLMSSVKKISGPPNNNSGTGNGYIQQQRDRMESISKKHKLDDEEGEVFQTPPLHPPGPRTASSFQPSGRSSQPTQPPNLPAGISPLPPANTSYAQMMQTHIPKSNQPSQEPPFRPRKQSTLLYGKAKTGKDNQTQLLAANVNLVASGVSKAATDNQLKEFLEDKGITVTEIECMTYHPEARTNTFRVAIAVADYEKALNPEVWPYRVAVRPFRPARKSREQHSMEAQFGRSGGVFTERRQDQHHSKQHNNQQQQPAQKKPEVVVTSNRFDVLSEGMDTVNN